jgi:hypothetical protein
VACPGCTRARRGDRGGIATAVTTTTVAADTHPGPVIVQVQEGYLKITQATCHPNVIGPGETYIETPGVPVFAEADHAATWTITEILPDSHPGDPDRVPAANPC